jgi:geranylgeranyl pyrophosphate synthase
MDLVRHAAGMQPRDWELPATVCAAVGGREQDSIPSCAAVACAQVGIVLIDDMLDEDPRGEYRRLGPGQTANLASAILSAASNCLVNSAAADATKLSALKSLHLMLMQVPFGQFLDSQTTNDEDAYWRLVAMKSGAFFRAVVELGALFGGAPADVVAGPGGVGHLYGEMIQIHDDLGDCMHEPASPDWLQGRAPLPILFATTVEHPERERFMELRPQAGDTHALRQLQEILVRCGAVSYCIHQLMRRGQRAVLMLEALHLPHPERLGALFDDVIEPARKLLAATTKN